jgi:hypothetical protein
MGTNVNVQPEGKPEIATARPQGNGAWRAIRGYILWRHERGSIQYDVMVTLILLFVIFSPKFINFNDRPVERSPHPSEVAVYPDGNGEFIYQVDGKAVQGSDDAGVRAQLLRIIEPISGSVSITRYEAVKQKGRVAAYKVWVQRE